MRIPSTFQGLVPTTRPFREPVLVMSTVKFWGKSCVQRPTPQIHEQGGDDKKPLNVFRELYIDESRNKRCIGPL